MLPSVFENIWFIYFVCVFAEMGGGSILSLLFHLVHKQENTCLLNILTNWEVHKKAFLTIMAFFGKSTCPFELRVVTISLFSWNTIFTWKINWQTKYGFEYLAHIYFKIKEVILSLQRKSTGTICWQWKIHAFKRKLEFRKNWDSHREFERFPIFTEFSDKGVGDINKHIFIKYVNIWKNGITQWASIFQAINVENWSIFYKKRPKWKIEPFSVTEYNVRECSNVRWLSFRMHTAVKF